MDIIQVPGLVAAVILGQKCGDQLFGKGLPLSGYIFLKLMADQQIGSETDYGNSDQDDYCKSGR